MWPWRWNKSLRFVPWHQFATIGSRVSTTFYKYTSGNNMHAILTKNRNWHTTVGWQLCLRWLEPIIKLYSIYIAHNTWQNNNRNDLTPTTHATYFHRMEASIGDGSKLGTHMKCHDARHVSIIFWLGSNSLAKQQKRRRTATLFHHHEKEIAGTHPWPMDASLFDAENREIGKLENWIGCDTPVEIWRRVKDI